MRAPWRRPLQQPPGAPNNRLPPLLLLLILHLINASPSAALDNGLARTPPMGWLAWERFVCETNCDLYPDDCIGERLFLQQAQRLAADGFRQLGYQYVNIDDCWSTRQRLQPSQRLLADPQRFPSGLQQLARQVHALGLKLGIYGDCGTSTCQGFPAQLAHTSSLRDNYFRLDAQTFAHDWQLDSFKFDACNVNVSLSGHLCPPMGDALNATGRPMLFSCSWPAYQNDEHLDTDWKQLVEKCNLWRAFGDIEDSWASVLDTVDWFVRKQQLVLQHHQPGAWFDADQLVVGNFGLSQHQQRAHMAIWCIWSVPLFMSNDLRALNLQSSELLRNKWLIQLNQDPWGVFGLMVAQSQQVQVFAKPVQPARQDGCPSYALVYFNRRTLGTRKSYAFALSALLQPLHDELARAGRWPAWQRCSPAALASSNLSFVVHDLFDNNQPLAGPPLALHSDKLELQVEPSGARAVKLLAAV